MEKLLEVMAKSLVDNPDEVKITKEVKDDMVVLSLSVAESDMGKVIGKSGRIAKALRQVLNAAATREKVKVVLDID
ncbi:MAG: KH domain-containing protein [Eubacteriales bacterium]|nr:KH domain-containing protein [Eubacteriales bacterium]